MSQWISIQDRLPIENNVNEQIVLVCTNAIHEGLTKKFISHFCHNTGTWCDIFGYIVTTDSRVLKDCKLIVTHWMPLPISPE